MPRLKADLSVRQQPLKTSSIHFSWEEDGFDLIRLYPELAEVRFASFPIEGAVKSLSDIFDLYWKSDEEYKFYELFG